MIKDTLKRVVSIAVVASVTATTLSIGCIHTKGSKLPKLGIHWCAGVDLDYVAEVAYKKQKYHFTDRERYLLAKISKCEAGNQGIKGRELVIRTVINRVESSVFPNDVESVIFQKNQFAPVDSYAWQKYEPDEDCWTALENVEKGVDESQGALYFESGAAWHRTHLKYLFTYKDHNFYTNY